MLPSVPAGTSWPLTSTTRTSKPGTGTDGDPALIGSVWIPRGLAHTAHPVSVCHQWSMTGMSRVWLTHW
jgi:hypothetical protein